MFIEIKPRKLGFIFSLKLCPGKKPGQKGLSWQEYYVASAAFSVVVCFKAIPTPNCGLAVRRQISLTIAKQIETLTTAVFMLYSANAQILNFCRDIRSARIRWRGSVAKGYFELQRDTRLQAVSVLAGIEDGIFVGAVYDLIGFFFDVDTGAHTNTSFFNISTCIRKMDAS